jgi:hypothetical protein
VDRSVGRNITYVRESESRVQWYEVITTFHYDPVADSNVSARANKCTDIVIQ